ncbi:alpha/beta-hydrolase [Trametopsis cervina]|nr:alpha/beta-hydrolase [Trametopsis cervina]
MPQPTAELVPLVIVEGFLSTGAPLLWGNFEEYTNLTVTSDQELPRRRVIFASVGPVSSLHDRACELYHALIGGTVDYGEDHARQNKHARYGRNHAEGLYPNWSRENPLHFLGHSLGGPTIVKLQWLISIGFFGETVHPDMLLSVNTVSSPFRGTQLVYSLGEEVACAPSVRPFSIGALLTKGVHLISYLSPLIPILDLHAEARSLAYHTTSFRTFLQQLWHSQWAEGKDSTPYDVTFQAADEREANLEGVPSKGTFYMSWVACMTEADDNAPHRGPALGHAVFNPALYILSSIMYYFDFSVIHPIPSALALTDHTNTQHPQLSLNNNRNITLRANDGVVPLFSQWHPFDCNTTRCRHHTWATADSQFDLECPEAELFTAQEPGLWNVFCIQDANHFSIVPFWFGTSRQRRFWKDIGLWLRSIDTIRIAKNVKV